MQSPYDFLVKPLKGRRYDNIIETEGGSLITSASKEDHMASNRFAEVIETPIGYEGDIARGDTLLVHHNVFKYYNAMNGSERSGKSFLFDDLFLIDIDQYYMYKHEDKWKCDGRSSFVRPVPSDNSVINRGSSEEPLQGEMVYPSEYASSNGIKEGNVIIFYPGSEYEFQVDGEKLYRIYDTHLLVKL